MRKSNALLTLTCLYTAILTFSGCWSYSKDEKNGSSFIRDEAFVPIYGIDSAFNTIINLPAQPTVMPGKIYVFGSNLFQVENHKGVHIIYYGDKANPVKTGFIKCGGATEIAVKNGYLVVNNAQDLVTIDISNLNNVKEIGRVKNAFKTFYTEQWMYMRPPQKGKYYVCPYPKQGELVIGWKLEKNVERAHCYNN